MFIEWQGGCGSHEAAAIVIVELSTRAHSAPAEPLPATITAFSDPFNGADRAAKTSSACRIANQST
jgi:hypothetical protein